MSGQCIFNGDKVEEYAVGIDLGTTNSLVAVMDHVSGRVNVLSNSLGKRSTPSCVSFPKEVQHAVLVGEPAIRKKGSNPSNTIFDSKRFIGMEYRSLVAKKLVRGYPFKVLDSGGNMPVFSVIRDNETVLQRPQDIAAKVLENLRETAERVLKDRADKIVRISKAVITVPAYFSMAQKQATLEAAELAGIPYVQLVTEPAAAAYAYGCEKKRLDGYKILVFDFGGGTFDVTILDVEDGKFVQRAIDGDVLLGGRDIDLELRDYVAAEIKKIHGADKDCMVDPRISQKLLDKCESLKIDLTTSQFEKDFFADINTDKARIVGISRDKFNELVRTVLMRTITIVQRVLKEANLTAKGIDEVLLVGGASRIPLVQSLLISEVGFSENQLNKSQSVDEAVAQGAAFVAAQLIAGSSNEGLPCVIQPLKLVEAIPLSIGVGTRGELFSVIIPRHTTIPNNKTLTYQTVINDQSAMDFNIYEGERKISSKNNSLGKLIIEDLPPRMASQVIVTVKLEIDRNGLLHASAMHDERTVTMDIKYKPRKCSDRTVSEALLDAEIHFETDSVETVRIQAKNRLLLGIERSTYHCSKRAKDICDSFKKWSNEHPNENAERYDEKHEELMRELGPDYQPYNQTAHLAKGKEMMNEDNGDVGKENDYDADEEEENENEDEQPDYNSDIDSSISSLSQLINAFDKIERKRATDEPQRKKKKT